MFYLENPFFEPILSEPEVRSTVERLQTRLDSEAARYQEMVAAGEIVIP